MIELELWYLVLLPLLFAAGWWLRGVDTRQRGGEADGGPRAYFRGLNYLLNEQPDKAIDAFIEVVKLDPETIDLHFALGNLFRRRGEVDRAVRIHTHLLNRADLPSRSRAEALAELGQDFLKAGLLDRAEESFTRLLEEPRHRVDALRALLRIYQMEREWAKAIDIARKLEREAGESSHAQVAHFHCESAEKALTANDEDGARTHLEQALKINRKSVRAAILAGDLAARRGNGEQAISHWWGVGEMNPEYLPLVAGRIADALDAADRRVEALNFLRRSLLDHPSIDLLDIAHKRASAWEGQAAADALLRDELQRHPSLLGFERLLASRAAAAFGDVPVEQLRTLIQAQARKLARYRCSKCGFRAREFHWQCPGCTSWDSYPPRRIEELDAQ
jgi:lipopolysaccharide biosynthesis regulator YciM